MRIILDPADGSAPPPPTRQQPEADNNNTQETLNKLPSLRQQQNQPPSIREWTAHELQGIICMICKDEKFITHICRLRQQKEQQQNKQQAHKKKNPVPRMAAMDWPAIYRDYAVQLNVGLFGKTKASTHPRAIRANDMRLVLEYMLKNCFDALSSVEQESPPYLVTRKKASAFERMKAGFNRKFQDWVELEQTNIAPAVAVSANVPRRLLGQRTPLPTVQKPFNGSQSNVAADENNAAVLPPLRPARGGLSELNLNVMAGQGQGSNNNININNSNSNQNTTMMIWRSFRSDRNEQAYHSHHRNSTPTGRTNMSLGAKNRQEQKLEEEEEGGVRDSQQQQSLANKRRGSHHFHSLRPGNSIGSNRFPFGFDGPSSPTERNNNNNNNNNDNNEDEGSQPAEAEFDLNYPEDNFSPESRESTPMSAFFLTPYPASRPRHPVNPDIYLRETPLSPVPSLSLGSPLVRIPADQQQRQQHQNQNQSSFNTPATTAVSAAGTVSPDAFSLSSSASTLVPEGSSQGSQEDQHEHEQQQLQLPHLRPSPGSQAQVVGIGNANTGIGNANTGTGNASGNASGSVSGTGIRNATSSYVGPSDFLFGNGAGGRRNVSQSSTSTTTGAVAVHPTAGTGTAASSSIQTPNHFLQVQQRQNRMPGLGGRTVDANYHRHHGQGQGHGHETHRDNGNLVDGSTRSSTASFTAGREMMNPNQNQNTSHSHGSSSTSGATSSSSSSSRHDANDNVNVNRNHNHPNNAVAGASSTVNNTAATTTTTTATNQQTPHQPQSQGRN